MFGKLTFRQLEDIGLLSGEVLSKVLLAGEELPRFKERLCQLSVTYDIEREIEEEILSMKPEVFLTSWKKMRNYIRKSSEQNYRKREKSG